MPSLQRPAPAGVTPAATAGDRARSGRPLERFAPVIGALVVALALAVYAATAARDIVFGDSPELIAVATTLGVAHAPGYPVWTLLGHAFSWLPVGSLPFRVGLLSVVCGAAGVGVVYAISLRVARSVPAAAAAALGLALHPLFWQWSIVAEVFALHALLAAIVVYCALRWAERPAAAHWLYGAALAGGLGLANQQTIVLVAPAVLYLLWRHRRALGERPLALARAAAFLALGLVPYLYLWAAGVTHPYWSFGDVGSPGDVLDAVLRRAYGSGQLIVSPALQGGTVGDRIVAFARSFTLLEAVLAIAGFGWLYRRSRDVFWTFAIALAAAGPAFVLYANANASIALAVAVLSRFYVLVHVLAAPVCAAGIRGLAELVARRRRAVAELGLAAVAAVAIAALAVVTYPRVDRSADLDARHFAEDLLASAPDGAILFVSGDAAAYPVQYLHSIEGARPDLSIVQPPYLLGPWYPRELRRLDPGLVVPPGDRPITVAELLDANRARPLILAGFDLDPSASPGYRLQQRGLDADIVPASAPLPDPAALSAENERLFATYRPPRFDRERNDAFTGIVLVDYTRATLRMGLSLESAGRFADARVWYQRGLAIEPDVAELQQALERIRAK
ncbi:MAG TPA: DUF2723 domain-containing protein [Candidatus Limnocylindria bacterium]|nr:DUF2723 domain-containing protein [Candidatus Limnocylindria bacterium]